MRRFYLLFIMLCLFVPVFAIDEANTIPPISPTDYPTYFQIQYPLSELDRQDISRRLLGVTVPGMGVSEVLIREIGETRNFRLTTLQSGGIGDVEAEIRAIGEHSYIWVDTSMTVSDEVVTTFAQRFDEEVYDFITELWQTEPALGIDFESRIHLLFSSQVNVNIAGYFSSSNSHSALIVPNSNELDMMVFNGFLLQSQSIDLGLSVAIHELQHLIHYQNDNNEDLWLNEGFSVLSQHLADDTSSIGFQNSFADNPDNQLTTFGLGNNIRADYGASTAFMIYLHDRFGLDFMQMIAREPFAGLRGVEMVLRAYAEPPVDVIFADWVVANVARQDDSMYGYSTLPDISPMDIEATYDDYPIDITGDTAQYSTHYYRLENVPSSLTITFESDVSVSLIDTEPVTGNRMWYSQRGDNSNTYVTFNADLTNTTQAQLTYDIWYDLEDNWDYSYITISADNGQTWELQSTSLTTTSDDNGRSYGEGYTGTTNGWIPQQIELSEYVGQNILIRFDMVSDDGVNQQGIALDNVQLVRDDELLEPSSVPDLSNGWILTDNRLPQRFWVQIIEHQADGIVLTRYLAQGDTIWSLDTHDDTDYITVAISPFAPMTTLSASYRLQVE